VATAPTPGGTKPVPKLKPAMIEWDGKTYSYEVHKITVAAAIAIKLHTGLGLKSWAKAVDDWDPQAVQALLFAMKQQNGEPVVIADLEFDLTGFMTAFEKAYAKSIDDAVAEFGADPSDAEASTD
jgi:hypothetical protein